MLPKMMMLRRYLDETPGDGSDNNGAATSTAAEGTPAVEERGISSTVNWSGVAEDLLVNGDEHDGEDGSSVESTPEVVRSAPPAPAVTPVAPTPAPATPPVATPAPVASVQPAPVVSPAAPVVATPAPVASVQPTPETSAAPVETAEQYRERTLGQLEQLYAISAEDVTTLITSPETVLPKLAAKVHFAVTNAVVDTVQRMMPQLLNQHNESTTRETAARNAFLSVNEDLADPKYEAAIFQAGAIFRQVNTSATPEQTIQAVGNMVRQAFGIPLRTPGAQPTSTPSAPAASVPFTPARGGGGAVLPSAPPQTKWGQLAEEFLIEDQ